MNRWRSDTLVTFQVIVATPLSTKARVIAGTFAVSAGTRKATANAS